MPLSFASLWDAARAGTRQGVCVERGTGNRRRERRERESLISSLFASHSANFHFPPFFSSILHPSLRKNEPALPFVGAHVRLRDARRVVPYHECECDDGGGESTAARGDDNRHRFCFFFLAPRPGLRDAKVLSRRPFFRGGTVARREEACDSDDELVGPRRRARSGEEKEKGKRKREKRPLLLPPSLLLSLSRLVFFFKTGPRRREEARGRLGSFPCGMRDGPSVGDDGRRNRRRRKRRRKRRKCRRRQRRLLGPRRRRQGGGPSSFFSKLSSS